MTYRDATYRATDAHFRRWMGPGFGQITGAAEPAVRPDGQVAAFTGTVFERLEGRGRTRIAIADDRGLRLVTGGPYDDRCPRWSHDGAALAFLSDRREEGVSALYVIRAGMHEATATPDVDGTVEYCMWSPDSRHVLLGVAGRDADLAGGQGSGTTTAGRDDRPGWFPEISGVPGAGAWRTIWLYDVAGDRVRRISPDGLNVWEATWLGPDRVAAVVSEGDPGENAWFTANLVALDVGEGGVSVLFEPEAQLGWPAGSPAGTRLAVVEGACSDRGIVAGDIRLIDPAIGTVSRVDTAAVDVTGLQWIDERRLGYTGVRGLETVVGWFDAGSGEQTELLSTDATSGARYPEAAFAANGTAALVLEAYDRPPAPTLIRRDGTARLASLAHPGTEWLRSVAGVGEPLSWCAPDGSEIQGILCRPVGVGPFPLVVMIHGGPVWSFRDRWRMGNDFTTLLVEHGYAVLHPNPRGSSGRGQPFAHAVFGDPGGADAADILAGVDELVRRGVADPARIGVTGGSYGGFMTCWLITRERRFAAAVAIAPVTDWYSKHHTSNTGTHYLSGDPYAVDGPHHARSPVMYARSVRTPTLLIAGALDRCTPPSQAAEFHNALREHGVETSLVVYPEEGHGVRNLPARIDAAARLLDWFGRHMPPRAGHVSDPFDGA